MVIEALTYNIRFFRKYTIRQTFWSHPHYRQLSAHVACEATVILGSSVHRQTKVCNFDYHIHADPIMSQWSLCDYLNQLDLTYMQFLAARSLWTIFSSERYSIPLATCKHMSSSHFLMVDTYHEIK